MNNILNYEGVLSYFYDTYIEERESFDSMEYRDVFFEIFSTADHRLPYMYYADAEKALYEIGVFDIAEEVREFYRDVYGMVDWKWSDSCLFAGAYFQYLAEQLFIEGDCEAGLFFQEIQDRVCNEEDDKQLLALIEADIGYFKEENHG